MAASSHKSNRNNHLQRKLSIENLERRRLLAADLQGYVIDRIYVKHIVFTQPAVVSAQTPAAQSPAVTQAPSLTPQLDLGGNTEIDDAIICLLPELEPLSVGSSGAEEVFEKSTGNSNGEIDDSIICLLPAAEVVTSPAPVVELRSANPAATPAGKSGTLGHPAAKAALFGLKTRPAPKATDTTPTYSGEAHVLELQNTDVSASGIWGSAAYQGTTRVLTASGKVTIEDDATKGKLSAKAEGDASLFKTDHHAQFGTPAVTIAGKEVATTDVKANATVLVGVTGSAEGGVNWNSKDPGLKGKANVFVGAEAKGDVSTEGRLLGVKSGSSADGYARAGAEASAEASLGKDGVEAKAGAFAGAKAGGNLKSSIAGIGIGVEGEGWAGQGGEAELSAKMDNGKFKFKTSLGASPIVGGKVGFNFEVDPSEVAKLADLKDEVNELIDATKANEEAQAAAAKVQVEAEAAAAKVQAEAMAAAAQAQALAAQANAMAMKAQAETLAFTNQVSNVASNVGSQVSNFGSQFVGLFG